VFHFARTYAPGVFRGATAGDSAGDFFKRVKPTLFSFRVPFVCSHVFPAFYFLCIYFLFISLLLIYFCTCIYLYINCGFGLLYE
jgi:hypothetical protein